MAPLELLIIVLALTIAAAAWQYLMRYSGRRALRESARRWGMHFVAFDRFRLAERMRELFPVPGAADLRVVDVMYGLEEDRHRYVFTVQYTVGVLRGKRREQRVAAMLEPRETGTVRPAAFLVADPHGELLRQYQGVATALGMRAGGEVFQPKTG